MPMIRAGTRLSLVLASLLGAGVVLCGGVRAGVLDEGRPAATDEIIDAADSDGDIDADKGPEDAPPVVFDTRPAIEPSEPASATEGPEAAAPPAAPDTTVPPAGEAPASPDTDTPASPEEDAGAPAEPEASATNDAAPASSGAETSEPARPDATASPDAEGAPPLGTGAPASPDAEASPPSLETETPASMDAETSEPPEAEVPASSDIGTLASPDADAPAPAEPGRPASPDAAEDEAGPAPDSATMPPSDHGDAEPGPQAPPIADEEGVLPGEPEDEPGIGLPAESAQTDAGTAPPVEDPAAPEESALPAPAAAEPDVQRTLYLLGTEVPPGSIDWLSWSASESFEGISTPTPVLIVNGVSPGPTLCLTAAVHGDELNGVEMVRRIMYSLDPEKLNGAVIGAPIVNLHGFRRSSRYLPDRRDLNRYFPGSPIGSSAARIAYSFFHEVIVNCDALVDVHTGSFHRANLPQLRADLNNPEVVELTKGFGATVVLHSTGGRGTLRRAATDAGIPALTLEAGEPMTLQPKEVAHGVKGIETLLDKLGMVNKVRLWGDPQPVYYEARWIRANTGGILFSNVNLGEHVREGEVLGTVTDPITNKRSEIRSPYHGRVIGRALNQVVMPGFAAFHVGIRTSEEQLREEPAATTAEAMSSARGDAAPGAAAGPDDRPATGLDAAPDTPKYFEEEERPE